jgi:hypothetical protein
MGLDVCVHEFVKFPDYVNTEIDLNEFCEKTGFYFITLDSNTPFDERLKTFCSQYIKKIPLANEDWAATFASRGLKYEEWAWVETTLDDYAFAYAKDCNPEEAPENTWLRIKHEDVIKKTELFDVILIGTEVGYQRKGANKQFYDDGKWDVDTWVITKEELINDWNKYFSDPDNEYYGAKARSEFKKNIIDHFEEGKTFVIYC